MANFAGLINSPPMDPSDTAGVDFALDFVDVLPTGWTMSSPTATIEQAGTDAGVTLSSVNVTETTKVTFRAAVSSGEQSNTRWDGDGQKYLVTIKVEDGSGNELHRSGFLWIAQR